MFDDDCRGADYRRDEHIFYRRGETVIEVRGPDGELIQSIQLPAVALRRDECSPAWLAMLDADERQPKD